MCHKKEKIQSLCLMFSRASGFFFYTKQTNKIKRNPQVIHSLLSDVHSELHGQNAFFKYVAVAPAVVPMPTFVIRPIPAAPALWSPANTLPAPTVAPQTVDWTPAAAEPAVTPAAVNPAAFRTMGAATTAPTPTAIPNLQSFKHQQSLLLSLSSLALCSHAITVSEPTASSYTVDWTAAAAAAQPAVTPAAVNSPAAMNQKKKKINNE